VDYGVFMREKPCGMYENEMAQTAASIEHWKNEFT
jgi:hypothetical protein